MYLFIVSNVFAQDSQFTQFFAAPTYLAPSFVGATAGTRAVLNARDQWPQIPGAFMTYGLSLDQNLYNLNSGVGLFIMRDQAGSADLANTKVGLQYSYDAQINKFWHVRPGMQLYFSQRSIDFSKLLFGDQMHLSGNASSSVEIPTIDRENNMDFGVSTIVYSELYWGGFLIDHISKPNESLLGNLSVVPVKFMLFGGYKHGLNGKIGLYNEESLNFAFNYKAQGKFDQLDLGAYWMKKPLVVGFWYRGIPIFKHYKKGYQNNDAIAILIGYQLEKIKMGFSYDFTISRLITSTSGAFEVSLIYEFNQDQKAKKKKKKVIIPCPKF